VIDRSTLNERLNNIFRTSNFQMTANNTTSINYVIKHFKSL